MPRILVGFDGSPPSRRALEHALRRAGHEHTVLLLNVVPPAAKTSGLARMMPAGLALPAPFEGTFEERARQRMEETLQELAKAGHRHVKGEVRLGETATTLLAAAQDLQADEIVIGHKSYESGQALGPNAAAIVRGAQVPVTVVP